MQQGAGRLGIEETRQSKEVTEMVQQTRLLGKKLPLSTAILSNIALLLLMWNLALRFALILGGWAARGTL